MTQSTEKPVEGLSNAEMRKFGLVTGLIVVVLFGFVLRWLFTGSDGHYWPFNVELLKPTWPWVVAFALWIPALLYPSALKPVYKAWMKIGEALGYVNSRIILFIFFYLILMPFGLILRVFGFDPMRRKLDDSPSYRIESKVPSSPTSMERPY
jgi:succinate dehydrogenase hydrophobic anchor subunit